MDFDVESILFQIIYLFFFQKFVSELKFNQNVESSGLELRLTFEKSNLFEILKICKQEENFLFKRL